MILETPRLILRPPVEADWPSYRDYRLSPRSTTSGESSAMAWTHFAAFFGHWSLRGFGRFIITLRESGRPVGHTGPHRPEGHPEGELTWTLWDAAIEGRGLAHEAALATRTHAFRDLGWKTAVSYIEPANLRSTRLAARLGAALDRDAPDPYGGAVDIYRHPRPEGQA